jgi:uncharacterized protein YndB with AHSA1/START domain
MTTNNPRAARNEVEIPTDPDQVWAAIATEEGNLGWNYPTQIEGFVGGSIRIDRSPHGVVEGKVTGWDPPHRLAYAIGDFATEMVVEARSGGTSLVRVVDTFSGDMTEWEALVDMLGQGWRMALLLLRGYVANFAGQPNAKFEAGVVNAPLDRTQFTSQLLASLGLDSAEPGDVFKSPDDAPRLAGVVESMTDNFVLVRSTEPAPGLFFVASMKMDEATTSGGVTGRIYGPDADEVAAAEQPAWSKWFAQRFPTS